MLVGTKTCIIGGCRPLTVFLTVWLALSGANEENGAMQVVCRSHLNGIRHHSTSGDGNNMLMSDQNVDLGANDQSENCHRRIAAGTIFHAPQHGHSRFRCQSFERTESGTVNQLYLYRGNTTQKIMDTTLHCWSAVKINLEILSMKSYL